MFNKALKGNFFWPRIYDEVSAREAAKQGWTAALFSGGITILMIAFGSTPMSSLVDVVIICFIGYGCLKMSRTAAIVGLVYVIFNGVYKYTTHNTFGLMPLFAIFYINSIRGTFNFHNNETTKSESVPQMLECRNCGSKYNPNDYRKDAHEWLCSQCGKALSKAEK